MHNKVITFCFVLNLLLSWNIVNATSLTVSGNASGTWSVDTVLVTGHLLVPAGEQLIIAPGTRIEFQSYFRLDVQGNIVALGSITDSIRFTIRDTSNFYSQTSGRGGWSGIRLIDVPAGVDSSLFRFCRFEFGKAAEDSANSYGGAIQVKNMDRVRISDCLFFYNYSYFSGGAVYLRNSNVLISGCTFDGNYSGNTGTIYGYGGGVCSMYSSPRICNNLFIRNSSTGVGGAVSFDYSDPVFNNNRLELNFSALGGGLGILRSSPVHTFSNNLVVNNSSLFFGGGVCCIRSFPVLSNFSISNNHSAYGGGLYCNDSAAPSLYNSIIYNNWGFGVSVYIWDVFSAPNFYYCNIEGDTTGFEGSGGNEGYHGIYLNNMDEMPSYYGSGAFPYQLNDDSPCIDAGIPDPAGLSLPETDLAGAARIWNQRIDMGAYEYNGTTGLQPVKQSNQHITAYPNPAPAGISFRFPCSRPETTTFDVLSLEGQVVAQLKLEAGSDLLLWNRENRNGLPAPAGTYILKERQQKMAPCIFILL